MSSSETRGATQAATQRVTLVTGAGNGLGKAFAYACARRGDAVIANNRVHADRPSSAAALVDALRGQGYRAGVDEHSIDAEGAAEAIVGNALDQFGRLDGIILNAGISGPAARISDSDLSDLRAVMEINFFANASLVQAALPHLKKSPGGRIVLIASSAGLHGLKGRAPYAASKAALIAYGRSLALELRRTEIRTNILAPYAATKMPGGKDEVTDERLLPENAAAGAVWLSSEQCEANGEIWVGGGGRFRRAAMVEGAGGGRPDADAQWLADNADDLRPLQPHSEFSGGEAAFADFYSALGSPSE
jgi:NAD(P)-dependent dehydrogenase (short-subunit alcohol dehydrogenase family)